MPKILLLALVLMLLFACDKPQETNMPESGFVEGGVYYSIDDDGTFSVCKILVIDENAYHVRAYANAFERPPTEKDLQQLTLGGLDDPAGFGIGHMPISRQGMKLSDYTLIAKQPVLEEELDGYKIWLEQ